MFSSTLMFSQTAESAFKNSFSLRGPFVHADRAQTKAVGPNVLVILAKMFGGFPEKTTVKRE